MTNFRMFYAFSIENQHVQFKVDPNSQNVDAAKVAEVLGKFHEKERKDLHIPDMRPIFHFYRGRYQLEEETHRHFRSGCSQCRCQ